MRTGGDKKCPTHLFFTDCEKTTTRSATTFSVPANNWIHLVSKFQPKVTKGQVTRSGQSKRRTSDCEPAQWPHYPIGLKLSAFQKIIVTYNLLSRIDICDLRSDQFRDLPITSQWAKIQIVHIERLCVSTTRILHNHVLLGYSLCSWVAWVTLTHTCSKDKFWS